MLKVENLKVKYGLIEAVKGVSFNVNDGEIVSLIGSNGAGKTTIMHSLSGLLEKEGRIILDGIDITKMNADKIVSMGLIQVPEGRRIFSKMSVLDNLKLGAFLRKDSDLVLNDLNHIFELFPILKERQEQMGGTLSGGEQQMLAMGRALMAKPKILLLDEPSMGLAPLFVKSIFEIIKEINNDGTTVFVVEQNANMALAISDRAYVMETGKIVLEGTGKELAASEEVRKAYLGG